MIAIIDYGAGNVKSVEKALQLLGEEVTITRDAVEILEADKVILPGVGAFEEAMRNIKRYALDVVIRKVIQKKTPFLGICLGMQVLFNGSEEGEGAEVKGLGILQGKIKRIPFGKNIKVPHIGWNSLQISNGRKLYQNVNEGSYVYFVHSYYLEAEDKDIVTATTTHGITIHASIEKDNVYGCQFHPEKSSNVGLQILKNFIEQ